MVDHSDFLHGVPEIAAFLGTSRRRCYYLLERRQIPAGKLGNIWTARRSRLIQHMEEAEDATLASGSEAA